MTNYAPGVVRSMAEDLDELLAGRVYPSLFERLDSAFPEFGWVRKAGGWEATRWPAGFPYPANEHRGSRLWVYADRPWWIKVHGHDGLRLLDYVNGGRRPRGAEFLPAARRLFELAGVPFPERQQTPGEVEAARRREERRGFLDAMTGICEEVLWSEAGAQALAYLRDERRLAEGDVRGFRLGVLVGDEAGVLARLGARGWARQAARDQLRAWRKLWGYVTIPWPDEHGRALTVYGRWPGEPPLKREVPAWRDDRGEDPRLPKTFALPGANSKSCPFCLGRALAAGHREVVPVEGLFDALLLQARGETRAVASVSAQLDGNQLEVLRRCRVERAFVCGDPDGGGDRGNEANVRSLARCGITPYVVPRLPDGQDPDEFVIANGIDAWRDLVARSRHGFRHLAERLLAEHGSRRAGDDLWADDLVGKAVDLARGLPGDRPDEVSKHFLHPVALAAGRCLDDLRRRVYATPNGDGSGKSGHSSDSRDSQDDAQGWADPIELGEMPNLPAFPADVLPGWLGDWAQAEAEATQTPLDLPAFLSLAVSGAAVARKFEVRVRDGWPEPLNLFVVVSLPPGERKSSVFRHALAPVFAQEVAEKERLRSTIATEAAKHRQMEGRLKHLEGKLAKEGAKASDETRQEAKQLALDLAAHRVPLEPRLVCDDATSEALARLLADHGGRMLLASAEGTTFEISKGRYSEGGKANFDVFLKGHAGDPLRVDRVGREPDMVDRPALSVALAVQPDVVRGLAEQASLKLRGFLARFLYSLPLSRVGGRVVAPAAVPAPLAKVYEANVSALWRWEPCKDGGPCTLTFSPEADRELQAFERWLEPRLAPGEELSYLAGWANKLAGACVRIAGVLYLAEAVGETSPGRERPVPAALVERAVKFGRDYLLPHAQAAFGLMAADEKVADATRLWQAVRRLCESSECSERHPPTLSRRDIHQAARTRQHFRQAEEIDPAIQVLVDRYYLRAVPESGRPGRGGQPSPQYEVNPKALALKDEDTHEGADPVSHCTHSTHRQPEESQDDPQEEEEHDP
jgi:hypothetical protein